MCVCGRRRAVTRKEEMPGSHPTCRVWGTAALAESRPTLRVKAATAGLGRKL